MLIGFFSWANINKYQIDLQKWQNKILVKRYTFNWLFAIAMFASIIHCHFLEIPKNVILILQKCLTSFGYPTISKPSLEYGYHHSGVQWLIVRNIISIDATFFNEYPLIVSELTRYMNMFKVF